MDGNKKKVNDDVSPPKQLKVGGNYAIIVNLYKQMA